MTPQKAIVQQYTAGFRRGDVSQILECLTDDVVFAAEADNGGDRAPDLHLDRLVEEGDTVAAIGHGCVVLDRGPVDFVYSEVFTFTGGLVSRLDTFHIWLGEVPQ